MKFARRVIATLFLLSGPAAAEISNPDLLQMAGAYRQALPPSGSTATVADLLAALNTARKANDAPGMIRAYEALIPLSADNAQSWLGLAKAWILVDATSDKGLGAAVRAAQIANPESDRFEALLVASSVLRSRLARQRASYDAASNAAKEATLLLSQTEIPEEDPLFVKPDPANPIGRLQSLRATIEDAKQRMAAASADIGDTAAALDDVYREIQATVPALGQTDLKADDERLEFSILRGEDGAIVDYQMGEGDARACIGFNKPLAENSLSYRQLTTLTTDDGPVASGDYDVQAQGTNLCFLRLEHALSYELKLSAALPAADGSVLGVDQTASIGLPDLPTRIGFGDGEFILPRSGPGEVQVTLTNAADFPLAIHRIVDRSIYRHLALGHISNGIPNQEYQNLLTSFSEVLWTGTAFRALDDNEFNKAVRTFIPVRRILEDRAAWLRDPDRGSSAQASEITSAPPMQPVRDISDPKLTINGTFVAGALDIDPKTSGLFVPGVYALVAPIPVPGQERKVYCTDPDDTTECQVYTAQWFVVSDIGLTFYEGLKEFSVVARSLETGGAVAGATVQLISKSNRLLAETQTDALGIATFPINLTRGTQSNQLVAILANTGSDFNFLKFGPERLDLSRLNVGGSLQKGRIDAVLHTTRGIYRPGETVEAFAMLRDRASQPFLANAELRLVIADYPVVSEPVGADLWRAGGMMKALVIPVTAKPGMAILSLRWGDTTLAEATIQIGAIKPDRVRLNFGPEEKPTIDVAVNDNRFASVSGRVHAQYLYGTEGTNQAAASGLKAEIIVRVTPAKTAPGACYASYSFGAVDEIGLSSASGSFYAFTDQNGIISLDLQRIKLPTSTKPLIATVEVTLFDAAGPVASSAASVPVPPADIAIGVASIPKIARSTSGYTLGVDVLPIGSNGRPANRRELVATVFRERESYSWEIVEGVWQHRVSRLLDRVASRTYSNAVVPGGSVGAGCPRPVTLEDIGPGLGDGRYILSVTDSASNTTTTVRFNTGVAQTSVENLEPNIFVLSSTKERYSPNETVELVVDNPFDHGKVLVAVAGDDIVQWSEHDIADGKIAITIDPAWVGKSFHVLATAFKADPGQRHELGPARAIGATYIEVTNEGGTFELAIERDAPPQNDFIREGETLEFDLCLGSGGSCGDAKDGDTYAIAFVVDEGLVSLTNHDKSFETATTAFSIRDKLGVRLMDNYGRLLLKEGGDRPGRQALSNYSSKHIVAETRGPVKVEDGRARFSFPDLQMQTGALRIYAIVWSANHMAAADRTVAVRNLLVTSIGMPDFVMNGDQPVLPMRVENIGLDDHKGDFALKFSGPIGLRATLAAADGTPLPTDASGNFLVQAPADNPADLLLTLDMQPTLVGQVSLEAEIAAVGAPDLVPEQERKRNWPLDIRSSAIAAVLVLPPVPIGSSPADVQRTLAGMIDGQFDPKTVKVIIRIAAEGEELRLAGGDATGDQQAGGKEVAVLDRLTWLGMIDLQEAVAGGSATARTRVQERIDAIQALQMVDGVFVPYRTDGDFLPSELGFDKKTSTYTAPYAARHGLLRNASALDFLTRAREAGFKVADATVKNSLVYLKARVSSAVDSIDAVEGGDAAQSLACAFDTRYAMLLLAQQDSLDASYADVIENCLTSETGTLASGETVLSDLVTLAVQSQYGYEVDTSEVLTAAYTAPSDYFADLDDYRMAIALSLLVNADGDEDVLLPIAERFLAPTEPLDLRTRSWLARSLTDLQLQKQKTLTASDFEFSNESAVTLAARADGTLESQPIAYGNLRDLTIAKASAGGARASFEISGNLIDAQSNAVPADSLRRRFFLQKNGREIDPTKEALQVGEQVVIVFEATHSALEPFYGPKASGIGTSSYQPLMVEALLPGAFSVVATGLAASDLKGDLRSLKLVGSIRSSAALPQGWRAIIVPDTTNAVTTLPKAGEEQDEGEDEGDVGGAEAGGEASPDDVQPPTDSTKVEFRQAIVVSVGASGTFSFPPTTVEALDYPAETQISQSLRFKVEQPRDRP